MVPCRSSSRVVPKSLTTTEPKAIPLHIYRADGVARHAADGGDRGAALDHLPKTLSFRDLKSATAFLHAKTISAETANEALRHEVAQLRQARAHGPLATDAPLSCSARTSGATSRYLRAHQVSFGSRSRHAVSCTSLSRASSAPPSTLPSSCVPTASATPTPQYHDRS